MVGELEKRILSTYKKSCDITIPEYDLLYDFRFLFQDILEEMWSEFPKYQGSGHDDHVCFINMAEEWKKKWSGKE